MERKNEMWRYLLLLLPIAICITWIVEIKRGFVPYADQWSRFIVHSVRETPIYHFFRFMTNFGSTFFIIPFVIIMTIALLFLFKDWLPALMFAGGTLLTSLINAVIKIMVARQRPSIDVAANAEGFSFPSGHAMVSIVCYGLLAFFLAKMTASIVMKRVISWVCAFFVCIIGISRFFINVHYLTDILTGFFLGGVILIVCKQLYEGWQSKRQSSSQS